MKLRHSFQYLPALLMVLLGGSLLSAQEQIVPEPTAEQVEFFETHIRPILASRCIECHGPKKQHAELRLDSSEFFSKGERMDRLLFPSSPMRVC
ncbi:MAG: c-type cytochrome domain-containing protein [Planctomycetaceae bacterium]